MASQSPSRVSATDGVEQRIIGWYRLHITDKPYRSRLPSIDENFRALDFVSEQCILRSVDGAPGKQVDRSTEQSRKLLFDPHVLEDRRNASRHEGRNQVDVTRWGEGLRQQRSEHVKSNDAMSIAEFTDGVESIAEPLQRDFLTYADIRKRAHSGAKDSAACLDVNCSGMPRRRAGDSLLRRPRCTGHRIDSQRPSQVTLVLDGADSRKGKLRRPCRCPYRWTSFAPSAGDLVLTQSVQKDTMGDTRGDVSVEHVPAGSVGAFD